MMTLFNVYVPHTSSKEPFFSMTIMIMVIFTTVNFSIQRQYVAFGSSSTSFCEHILNSQPIIFLFSNQIASDLPLPI